jgi:hypothetical protein
MVITHTAPRVGRRQGPALAAALFAAALAGPAPAATPGPVRPRTAPEPALPVRDWRLALLARRTLQEDEALARRHLGVSVRDGVATVWGTVPSADAARLAVQAVKQVPGVVGVRSELTVAADEPVAVALGPSPRKPSSGGEPASPERITRRPGLLTLRPEEPPAPPTEAVSHFPPVPPPARELIALLPPVPLPDPAPPAAPGRSVSLLPPQPLGSADALTREVERLRQRDERFHRVEATAAGGVVTLRGSVRRAADLHELEQAVRGLPGVKQVVVSAVRVVPYP